MELKLRNIRIRRNGQLAFEQKRPLNTKVSSVMSQVHDIDGDSGWKMRKAEASRHYENRADFLADEEINFVLISQPRTMFTRNMQSRR